MTCAKCGSHRIADVSAKCSDMFTLETDGQDGKHIEHVGYVLPDINIGGGDYVRFTYCLQCGYMQGQWPVKVPVDKVTDYR